MTLLAGLALLAGTLALALAFGGATAPADGGARAGAALAAAEADVERAAVGAGAADDAAGNEEAAAQGAAGAERAGPERLAAEAEGQGHAAAAEGQGRAAAAEGQGRAAAAAAAAEPRRLIVVDAGHGGASMGAVRHGVIERDSNLEMALRVEGLLVAAGFDVILTRRGEERVAAVANLPEAPESLVNRRDLQARVDLANAVGADLFIAIHSNGASDSAASGIEVWYDGRRAFAAENETLAQALQGRLVSAVERETGWRPWDRGVREDSCWNISERNGECSPLFVLGPAQEVKRSDVVRLGIDPGALGFAPGQERLITRPTRMPAALVELLFITHPFEAAKLKDEATRQALALGIVEGIVQYFTEQTLVTEAPAAGAG